MNDIYVVGTGVVEIMNPEELTVAHYRQLQRIQGLEEEVKGLGARVGKYETKETEVCAQEAQRLYTIESRLLALEEGAKEIIRGSGFRGVVLDELRGRLEETGEMLSDTVGELEETRRQLDVSEDARRRAEKELKEAQRRITTLENALKAVRESNERSLRADRAGRQTGWDGGVAARSGETLDILLEYGLWPDSNS